MRGKIVKVNSIKGVITVETESGDYSSIELLGDYSPENDDIVSGNLDRMGRETIKNLSQKEDWSVSIEDIHGSAVSAEKFIS